MKFFDAVIKEKGVLTAFVYMCADMLAHMEMINLTDLTDLR